ncbi:uncharacterized protein [Choristoneura fumiferana]|uniref:uncharacterized protein n=1 Tax=Choristoneura fumiferana TaxID=7141 RepID=UPI003D154C75
MPSRSLGSLALSASNSDRSHARASRTVILCTIYSCEPKYLTKKTFNYIYEKIRRRFLLSSIDNGAQLEAKKISHEIDTTPSSSSEFSEYSVMNTYPPNSTAMKTRKQCREAGQHQREGEDAEDFHSGEDDGASRADGAPTSPNSRAFTRNETAKESNTIAITEEQLSSLLSSVMRNAMQHAAAINPVPAPTFSREATPPAPSPSIAVATGNMAKCTARFDGRGSANADRIESFIDAVEMFVECMNISEEHALRGLTMLFTDDAATWWRGVKSNVKTWAEATTRMRAMYGAPRPAYKLLRDIFASEQNDERAETFISRIRATFAKFPYEIDIRLQLDIVYGLLNRKVRKSVPRESVNDVESLLMKARDAEEARIEVGSASVKIPSNSDNSQIKIPAQPPRGASVKPHDRDVAAVIAASPSPINAPPSASELKFKTSRPRCSYCKSFGHTVTECRKIQAKETSKTVNGDSSDTRSAIKCYGCNRPGVVRSRCDTCNTNRPTTSSTADFQSLNTLESIDSSRPLVDVTIAGRKGVAILDTGASQSVASPALHKLLVNSGVEFTPTRRTVGLADGSNKVRDILTAQVSVTIGDREALVDFLVFPDSQCRTLLGRDFILNAGIIVNIPQCCFSFQNAPNQMFTFVESFQLTPYYSDLMQTDTNSLVLRGDEGHTLSSVERSELNRLICNSEERFATEGPATDFATHHIKVSEDQQPIACQPFRMSQNRRAALKDELDKLLTAGVIEECESPWAANVVMVPKKDGGMRLCIDYRKLNEVTEPDRYPLPRIEDILHAAKTSNYMTTLDLRSGYFQVNVDPADRDKTCFITPMGTYRFIRMPMGLRNSGATFQRLIDRFKANLDLASTVLAYLDDIIVLSPDFQTHLKDLKTVFTRLAKFNLRVNRNKSCFACQSVKFLGHVIVPGGIHMDPDKTSAITAMPLPQNAKHLKCFLQTSSWFRRFIPGYADVARPLTNLLKKDSVWCWGEQQQRAFDTIKTLLTTAPILRQADEAQPFVLRTDSSGELRAPHDAASDMRAIVERDTAVCSVTPYLRRLAGALLDARDVHERAQARHKAHADGQRRPAPDYDPGTLVLLKTQGPNDTGTGQTAKFIPRRDGPYRVREAVGPTTYLLERVSDGVLLGKYHTSHLTPFVGDVQPAVREKRRRGRPRRYLD